MLQYRSIACRMPVRDHDHMRASVRGEKAKVTAKTSIVIPCSQNLAFPALGRKPAQHFSALGQREFVKIILLYQ
jgi:hypothetical protein